MKVQFELAASLAILVAQPTDCKHAYGSMLFDLKKNVFSERRFKSTRIRVCSNEKFFCIKSERFDITLPVTCDAELLSHGWSYDGIDMVLVDSSRPSLDPHSGYSQLIVYRPSTKKNTLIFVKYTPGGEGYISQLGYVDGRETAAQNDLVAGSGKWATLTKGEPLATCHAAT